MSIFKKYAHYYDLLYADKNYEQEACYIDTLIRQNKTICSNILEFGCGTGKHAQSLVTKGYEVHGVDISPEMVACAQKQFAHEKLTYSCADIRSVNLNKKFDAIISLFHVMSYQVSNNDLNAVFARASEHLEKTGLFIFDAWYGPAVLTEKPSVRIKRAENDSIRVTRVAEPSLDTEKNRVDVHFTVFFETKKTEGIEKFTEQHAMRYLFVPEIAQLCERHGFEIALHEEWVTGKPLDSSTWGACFVCRKL